MIKEKFTKEDTGMGNKHIKRCSTPLVISEMQAKEMHDITAHPQNGQY